MRTYNELIKVSSQERFAEIFSFITKGIKNKAALDLVKNALLGKESKETSCLREASIICELCAKGFVSAKQADALIELSQISK